MKNLFLLLCSMLPNHMKIFIYRKILGWDIGTNVRIGFSYINTKLLFIGDNTVIGHFNIIRRVNSMKIGEKTLISNFNCIYGASHLGWKSTLSIGSSVNFMSHHFLDVGGSITIGDSTIIGGRDSQFWSHGLAYDEFGNPALKPLDIFIGDKVYIGARSTLIGCSIPDRTVVGAGSVVTKSFEPKSTPFLIAGNPAIIKKYYKSENEE
jgi:acetyltransferase-like isoleucine patch superfamily enzyme